MTWLSRRQVIGDTERRRLLVAFPDSLSIAAYGRVMKANRWIATKNTTKHKNPAARMAVPAALKEINSH